MYLSSASVYCRHSSSNINQKRENTASSQLVGLAQICQILMTLWRMSIGDTLILYNSYNTLSSRQPCAVFLAPCHEMNETKSSAYFSWLPDELGVFGTRMYYTNPLGFYNSESKVKAVREYMSSSLNMFMASEITCKKTKFKNKMVKMMKTEWMYIDESLSYVDVYPSYVLPIKSTAAKMISDLILITLAPAFILFSLPLTVFAAITTILALSTLFLRALIAYSELAALLARNQVALISSQLISHTRSSSASTFTTSSSAEDPPTIISTNGLERSDSRQSKLSHRSSIASNGPLTPRPAGAGESNMSGGGIYGLNSAGVFGQRDFEGVGGWSMEDSDDDEEEEEEGNDVDRLPWTVMNSRLELPYHVTHDRRDANQQQRRSGSSLSSFIPTRPTSWHALLTPSSSRRPMSLHAKTPSSSTTCSTSTNSGADYFHYQNV